MVKTIRKNLLQKWTRLPVLAIFIFLLTRIVSHYPQFVEEVYSRNIYPLFATILSFVSSALPFSIDDVFYLCLIGGILISMVLFIIQKVSFKNTLLIVLNLLSATFSLFYLLWGFNYFRQDLNERLDIAGQKPDNKEFIEQFERLVENTNNSRCRFENFRKQYADSLIELGYKNLAPALKINYPAGTRNDKGITFSRFFAGAGISGYFGPFFNEVHVNKKLLPIEYPFVLAHEKAHQLGVTSEAEANFYSWLVCTQSNSEQLRYSANLSVLKFFLYQGYQLKAFKKTVEKLKPEVKADYRRIEKHWDGLRNEKVNKVASKVNDTYLKSNKVEKGIEDYFGVVKFIIDFRCDSAFQKKYGLLNN